VAGKYRVERVLGKGGMGIVVAARHVQLGELVAIKLLLPEMTMDAEIVQRFSREARAAVRIKSEHVARVSDVGTLDTGAPYMVMEYLHGSDLGAVLTEQGALPLEDAVDFVAQACEAIAEAHALGIVHRDLKPSNLMLVARSDGTPCIKVLDFGISKIAVPDDGPDLVRTKTATALGSPLYMSPEQMVSARDVDGRTDIWALGAILYELVSGRPPFVAESFAALVLEVTQSPLTPLRRLRGDVPAGLEAVVARCLAKDREERYATVADLARAIAPFAPERAKLPIERALRILRGSGPSNVAISETLAQSMRNSGAAPRASDARPPPHFPTSVNFAHTAKAGGKRGRAATLVVVGGTAAAAIAVAAFSMSHRVATAQPAPSGAASLTIATASNRQIETTATSEPSAPVTALPSGPLAEHPEPASSATVPQTATAPQSATVKPGAPPPIAPSRPFHANRVAKARASAPSPTPPGPPTPAAPPVPAPQPTAPKGSAYDDM